METTTTKPVIIYAESTPNPASMKFVADRLLVAAGATAQYLQPAEAKNSPLALELFNFPFVKAVYFASNFVTITKTDAVRWDEVTLELREFLKQYISEGKAIVSQLPSSEIFTDTSRSETKQVFTEHTPPQTEAEQKIVEVLEQYIRPAVEQDGGLITFRSYNEGVVTVTLRGACSGCPSSSITLKAGIEALLKRMVPGVKEVVAEAL